MIPTLLCVLYLSRTISYVYSAGTEFNFSKIHSKLQDENFNLIDDSESLKLMIGEIGAKGLLPQ